ncbi:ribonuclease H-like domain-containing protein [Tanacetum coccineum]
MVISSPCLIGIRTGVFQSLLSQLEIHGAGVSTENANQKFLRSLPSAWSQVSLIMRTKPGVDSLSFDDLYNNLRVFESDVKGSTASSSSTQNVVFVSENTSSTNEVSTTYGVSNSSGHNSQSEHPSSYSFLANQSSCPQLDHEDLEQLDEFDLEEMDLKWQVAMISMRMKKFYKKKGRKLQFDAKEPVGFDKTKVECYNCHKTWHFARECRSKRNQDSRRRDAWNTGNKDKYNGRRSGKQEEPKALVTLDGEGVDWTSHSEDEEQLGDASIEIHAYTQALKKVEAQLVAHQQNQLWYEEKIRFMKIDLDDKIDVLTYHKKLLAETEKEKEELKAKVEKWHNSSKSLNILLNSQMSTRDKAGLGYGDQMNKGVLSYENEVFGSLFDIAVGVEVGRELLLSPQQVVIGDPKGITGTKSPNTMDYPQRALNNKGIVNSGCSRHMTGNKAHLAEYQDYNGGPVSFGVSLILGLFNLYKPISIAQFTHIISPNRSLPPTLIFSSPTTTNSSSMAALESCPKHNMIAYLEKTDENAEFHEIMDFLTRSSIYYALILKNVPIPLDHFPINALTSKVLSFMVKKGKNFSGNVTPLFDSMLVQPTKDEGEALERPSKSQPIPSPPHPSEDQPKSQPNPSPRPSLSIPIPNSNPEGSGGNHGAKEIKDLKAQIKTLKKKARPVITHQTTWMKSVSIKTRLAGKKSMQKKWMQKESVSKQGRKTAKSKPTAYKDQAFDDLDDFDAMDYMETEDAHNEKRVSTEDQVSTAKPNEGTDKPKVSTDKIDEGTAELKNENSDENATPIATPTVFGDDETIAEFLVSMSQNKAKQKGVEIKDAEDSDRPRPTSTRSLLTLKPLPKIDPKDKGKKVLEEEAESDAESEGVNEAERKFAQLANDEEIARKVQEEWETEEEKKKLAEEEATKAALIRDYDDIQARIEADSILAARLQEEEREKFTIEERAKLLYDTIAAQRRFDKDFIAIGSAEDERQIKKMNEESKDPKKKRVVNETPREEDTTKVPAKQEVTKQSTKKRKSGHVEMIARKI